MIDRIEIFVTALTDTRAAHLFERQLRHGAGGTHTR